MSKKIIEIILILSIFSYTLINCFIFPNKEIENAMKESDFISRTYNLTSISQLKSFMAQKKNIFLYFYSNFCSGCKELLNSFNKVSSYEFVYNSSNILLVDCSKYQEICFNFELETLPYLKIYYIHPLYNNYTLINYTFFSFEFNDVINLVQKISNSFSNEKYQGLIKLKSQKDINKFSNTLGDVSFLLILNKHNNNKNKNKNLLQCYNNDIALNPDYITKYFFAYNYKKESSKKKEEEINNEYPMIYMTGINYNDFNLNIEVESCDDIKKFINNNEFPIFANYNSKYLLIFGYLDINEDESMLSFFKINKQILDSTIIVYDFKKGKYHLREYINNESLEKLINDFDNKKLEWKSGYFLEDFLSGTLGLNINRNYLIFFFMMIFSGIIIFGCIFCFQTFEKIDKKLK